MFCNPHYIALGLRLVSSRFEELAVAPMENVTIFTAFVAGLISFLSPCVLPLVPGYVSIISGFSLDQLKVESQKPALSRAVFVSSLMFILGFSITFISLGASATWLGQVLLSKMTLLYRIAGVIIIVFGGVDGGEEGRIDFAF